MFSAFYVEPENCEEALRLDCADRELNPGYELGKLMSYH